MVIVKTKYLVHLFRFVVVMCISQLTLAEVIWIPNAGINNKTLDFDRPFTPGTTNAGFLMLDVSVTAAFETFFVTANANLPTSDESTTDTNGPVTVDRDDSTLTIGCNCIAALEKLTVFAGYTIGNTTIVATTAASDQLLENYEDTGFFIGGSYPLWNSEYGALTGSFAYAFLDGTVQIQVPALAINETRTGDTSGTSLGLIWTGGLTDDTNYTISLKRQGYVFEETGGLFSLDQTYSNLSATVTYFF